MSCARTEQDVFNYLAQVKLPTMQQGYIRAGEKPPPPKCEFEDVEEINQRFGVYASPKLENGSNKPDLAGITKCIRMVEAKESGHDKPNRTKWSIKPEDLGNKGNDQIVVSKLNPGVKEFLPKNISVGNGINSEKDNVTRSNDIKNVKSPTPHKPVQDSGLIASPTTDDDEKNKTIAMLKDKISKIPKNSSLKERKVKNVAIAALIKAHSSPSPSSSTPVTNVSSKSSSLSSISGPRPLLLTPEYFQQMQTTAVNTKTPDVKSSDTSSPKMFEEQPECTENAEKPEKEDENVPETQTTEIKESINKVNNWLDKKKSPLPFMGQIVYKKKKIAEEKSSVRSKSPIPDAVKYDTRGPCKYVPSEYASNLVKSYKERNKATESYGDLWTNLDKVLKAKDEEIRRKQREKKANSSSAVNNVTESNS